MEWFHENPGGLPRYFADYLDAWRRHDGDFKAVVQVRNRATLQDLPTDVRGVYSEQTDTLSIRRLWKTEIGAELGQGKYDVWNPHFAYYAWGAMSHPALRDMPVVTHFHGPWAYESAVEYSGVLKQVRFMLQKNIERRVYRQSDRFIVLSESFKQILIDNYHVPPRQIHVIPGGVDVDKFHPVTDREKVRFELGLPTHRTVLVCVRRLARRMGLERLIQAVSSLAKDFSEILLVVVGTGELASELRRLVDELHLEKHVIFAGRVSDDNLTKYYQAANFSVVPSISFEGFGLVTTESLACGTPVVGTRVGGTQEILQGLSPNLLVSGTEISDLVEGLGTVLSHPSEMPGPERCREYVLENYTWDVIIPQIQSVFHSAIGVSAKQMAYVAAER